MTRDWWRGTWLMARRETDERMRARSFRVVTVIMILAVACAVVVPALVGHQRKAERVGLVGAPDPGLGSAVTEAGRLTGNAVVVLRMGISPPPELGFARGRWTRSWCRTARC